MLQLKMWLMDGIEVSFDLLFKLRVELLSLIDNAAPLTSPQLLDALKLSHQQFSDHPLSRIGEEELDEIWNMHGSDQLQVCGRYKTLLYRIISITVSEPRNGAVLVIDTDGKFDITKLDCGIEDMKHVWVIRTRNGTEDVQQALKDGVQWLTYGENASKGRHLALKIVSGGSGGGRGMEGVDIIGGWRGWLRVDGGRQEIAKFAPGLSVEEALREDGQRRDAVERAGWTAVSEEGAYHWYD